MNQQDKTILEARLDFDLFVEVKSGKVFVCGNKTIKNAKSGLNKISFFVKYRDGKPESIPDVLDKLEYDRQNVEKEN